MTSHEAMDDDRAERLLSRRGRTSAGAYDPAVAFVAAVADLGRTDPVPTGALAALLADGIQPARAGASAPVKLPSPVQRPAPVQPSPGRRSWLADLPLRARVLAASGVALLGLATAATAGVLPSPVQDGVGGILEAVTPFEFPATGDPTSRVPQDGPNGGGTGDGILVPSGPPDPPAADLQVPEPVPQPLPVPEVVPNLGPAPVMPPVPAEDSVSTAPGPPAGPRAGTAPPEAPGPPAEAPGSDIAPGRAQRPAGMQQGDESTLSGRDAVAPAAVMGAGRPVG